MFRIVSVVLRHASSFPYILSLGVTKRTFSSNSCSEKEIPIVKLFTSPSCNLCDEVLFQLEQLRHSHHFKIDVVNIK